MENIDWSRFTKRIAINASIKEIFNAWITQEEIEKWFLSKAEFSNKNRNAVIQKDDTYVWHWHASDFVAEGEVLFNNGKDHLEFTFLGCLVTVKVKEESGENILEITQYKIPLDEESKMNLHTGCSRGWTFYATNLKSILEGGIDLRNKNEKLNDVINT